MGSCSLDTLPADVLQIIGDKLSSCKRSVVDSAQDAAAVACTNKSLFPLAQAAWSMCARVAEASPDAETVRDTWCCIRRKPTKTQLIKLAMTVPGMKSSMPLWIMERQLQESKLVGAWCPIERCAAVYIMNLKFMQLSIATPPIMFRDRDLSKCPRVPGFNDRIYLRHALLAPKVDPLAALAVRMEELSASNKTFHDAGVSRNWRETDLDRRLAIIDAETWGNMNLPPSLRGALILRATHGMPQQRAFLLEVTQAFKSAGLPVPYMSNYAVSSDTLRMRIMLSHGVQLKFFGYLVFPQDIAFVPSLQPGDVTRAVDEILVHHTTRKEVLAAVSYQLGAHEAHNISLQLQAAGTLDVANGILADAIAGL